MKSRVYLVAGTVAGTIKFEWKVGPNECLGWTVLVHVNGKV